MTKKSKKKTTKKTPAKRNTKLETAIETLPDDPKLTVALKEQGINTNMVAEYLKSLFEHETFKIDKNGEVHRAIDGSLRLKAIELYCKISGEFAPKQSEHKELAVKAELGNVSDTKLNQLLKAAQVRDLTKKRKV